MLRSKVKVKRFRESTGKGKVTLELCRSGEEFLESTGICLLFLYLDSENNIILCGNGNVDLDLEI